MITQINTKDKYLETSGISLSIWVVANLLNLVLILMVGISQDHRPPSWDISVVILAFSAFFSFPGLLIFWMVFLRNCDSPKLFTCLLITAILTSAFSVLLLCLLIGKDLVISLIFSTAVIAAIISVFIHRKRICSIIKNKAIESHV